jgi:drug/metabolite transporter (DMT)-like permease
MIERGGEKPRGHFQKQTAQNNSIMNHLKSGYLYIFVTIFFTVVGQLLVKAGIARVLASFSEPPPVERLIIAAFLHPAVVAGLGCAFIAAVAWLAAVSHLPISVAYPFMALPIVLVLCLSPLCFGERVTMNQWLGVGIVSFGLWLAAH